MTKASDLLRAPTWNLSGAVIPINTVWDFVEAQMLQAIVSSVEYQFN